MVAVTWACDGARPGVIVAGSDSDVAKLASGVRSWACDVARPVSALAPESMLK